MMQGILTLAALCMTTLLVLRVLAATPPISRQKSHDIPLLGFGTWNLDKSNASDVVADAIRIGYRHIDCAAAYGNEKEVGKGIRRGMDEAGLKRKDIWVTSKLWNDHHEPSNVARALDQTLDDLGLEYLDLYLMHWPVGSDNGTNSINFVDTWKTMTALQAINPDVLRHLGICNFSPAQLDAILAATPSQPPYSHQMELHPYLQQKEWIAKHRDLGIHVTAYSPLGNTNPTYTDKGKDKNHRRVHIPPLLENDILRDIVEHTECASTAQVALAWGMSRGTSVIPKSAHPERMLENYDTVGKCKLGHWELEAIDVDIPGVGWVKRFNNPSDDWEVDLFKGLEDVPCDVDGDDAREL